MEIRTSVPLYEGIGSLPVSKTFCKILYTVACNKKIFHHTVPMIFLYLVLQSENQNINLGGASEYLKTVFKYSIGGWVESIYQFFMICMGAGWSRCMETHIASVETVLVYNLGEASSSKEVNL